MVKPKSKSEGWVTFDPELKILDCTIRDGGLVNAHYFNDEFVKAVYDTCLKAGIDYMELGYKASKKVYSPTKNGPWKFCDEDDLRRIVGDNDTCLKLSAMADAERTDYHEDILPAEQSVLDCIRVATYIHQLPTALDMVKDAKDKGYEVSLNLMAVSAVPDFELNKGIEVIAKCEADYLYIVDSFGSLYHEQIDDLLSQYKTTGKILGIHAHNNQQLAYSNTIYAAIHGAKMLDTTMMGMGRGAGNCPTELLVGFLKNPKFTLRPILEFVQKYMLPLRDEMDWGYSIPYMITGQFNEHPRTAIALRKTERKDDYVGFYDEIISHY